MEDIIITILYVDDEIPLLQIGKIFLEKFENIRVDTAPSGREALEKLSAKPYDAIVSDYQMPEMNGIALLQAVRRDFGDIPFILFTGRGREEIVIQAINEGADFYIQKGGDPKAQFAELAHKIRQAVRTKEAEHQLKESEQRYRSIVQDQTEMIVRFSPDGRITFSNDIYTEYFSSLLGLDRIVGRNIREIMQEKNFDAVDRFLDSLTLHSPVRDMERVVSDQGGEKHWQLYTVRSLFNEDGEKIEYQVVGRDITERKNIEEQLIRVLDENRERFEEEKMISDFSQFLLRATSPEEVLDHFSGIIHERSGADYLVLTKLDQATDTVGFHSLIGFDPFMEQMNTFFQGKFKSMQVSMDFIVSHQDQMRLEPGLRLVEGGVYEISRGYLPKPVCTVMEKVLGIKKIYTFEFIWNEKFYGSVNFAYRAGSDIQNPSLISTLSNLLANGIWRIYSTEVIVQDKESLRASEERYRTIVETAQEGILIFDADNRIVSVNDCMANLLGYNPADMEGRMITDFLDHEEVPEYERDISGGMRGVKGRFERHFRTRDGRTVWALISSTPIHHDTEHTGTFMMVTDITDRKEAEEALRQSETSYRGIINTIRQAIYILDSDAKFLDVNAGAERMYGYKHEEFIGKTPDFLSAPGMNDLSGVAEKIRQAYSGEYQKFGFWGIRKNGEVFPKDVFLYKGSYFGQDVVIAIGVDITERKQMENILIEKRALLEAQVESSIDGILVVNENRERILTNKRLIEMWKIPPEIVDDPNDEALLRFVVKKTRNPDSFYRKVMDLYAHPKEISQDIVEFTDGMVFERYSAPVLGPTGRFYGRIWTFREITKRIRAEEALKQANKKLSLLSSITRHDILNQVTSLLGYLTLSLDEIPEGTIHEYLKKSEALTQTIQHQITFTRVYEDIGSQDPVWQNVDEVIQKALIDIPENSLSFDLQVKGLMIYADNLFEKVIFTLVENTLRHSERSSGISLSYMVTDPGMTLIYQDNGIGITDEDKPRIFDPGYGKNTGFGLFLSKEILAITGMTITETGESGKGARFEILVPEGAYRFSDSNEQNQPAL